jgi:hypothetical protein
MAASSPRHTLANGPRLADAISLGVLTRTFPPDVIDEVVERTKRKEKRYRLLPARVVVYFVLALCLFAQEPYTEVMSILKQGLRWAGMDVGDDPSDTALVNARRRLGHEPLEALFREVAVPLATPATQGGWYRGLRLMAIDGSTFDVPDTVENVERFGRPGSARGDDLSAFPQARMVGLTEIGTHAIVAAEIDRYATSEMVMVTKVMKCLRAGMLLLADRGFWSFDLWEQARKTDAELLFRTKAAVVLPVVEVLDDGSYLSHITASSDRRAQTAPTPVRVIEYCLQGRSKEVYRLVTTLLDPSSAPAAELACLYGERWEIETALDELKTHQRGAAAVLRSHSPDGVIQELWAHLLVHYALRSLMLDAAHQVRRDPDRMSFMSSLRIVRRQTIEPAAFSP